MPAIDDGGRYRRLWKSLINIATSTRSPASSDDKKSFVVSSVVSRSCVSHDSPDLKPCWNMVSILCRSKWFNMCSIIKILHEIDVNETGLYFWV